MPVGDIGRAIKQKSGNIECYDLVVNGRIILSQGIIQIKDNAGRLGAPTKVSIRDQDGVEIANIDTSGNINIKGQVQKV